MATTSKRESATGLCHEQARLLCVAHRFRLSVAASNTVGALAPPGLPEDLAANLAFLFSDDGAYVTGQTIVVDGGANFT